MFAYADSTVVWGHMLVCKNCILKAPAHVDTRTPVAVTPAMGKRQRCDVCQRFYDMNKLGTTVPSTDDRVAMPSEHGPLAEIVRKVCNAKTSHAAGTNKGAARTSTRTLVRS